MAVCSYWANEPGALPTSDRVDTGNQNERLAGTIYQRLSW